MRRIVAAPGRLGQPVHCWISVLLTLAVFFLDTSEPWGFGMSMLYLIPLVYVGWAVTGRTMWLFYAVIALGVLVAPLISDPDRPYLGQIRNRSIGVFCGILVGTLLWERRRIAMVLERLNTQLERRVSERTAELNATNRALVEEMQARQTAEENLRQVQKMEAIGNLAGGIAHDFNNLLTVINGYASMLIDGTAPGTNEREAAEQIAIAGDKAADLTRKLLSFSRRQMLQPVVLNLNEVITGLEKLLRRLLPENVRIVLDLHPTKVLVRIDRTELEHVLLNLATNARDAMPQGGEFRLTTVLIPSNLTSSQGGAMLWQAELTATDTGCGMDEKTRERIFEPFFTTKKAGQGTGLGLASVYGVIRQSGGSVEVKSQLGAGTSFVIRLPSLAPTTEFDPGPVGQRVGVSPIGRGTILLAEDDGAIRALSARVLRRAGYEVLEAADGIAALEIARGFAGTIDVLVTDVVMPACGGPELAARLLLERRYLRVLFVSGYTAGDTGAAARRGAAPAPLLPKPYTHQALVERVGLLVAEARAERETENPGTLPGVERGVRIGNPAPGSKAGGQRADA